MTRIQGVSNIVMLNLFQHLVSIFAFGQVQGLRFRMLAWTLTFNGFSNSDKGRVEHNPRKDQNGLRQIPPWPSLRSAFRKNIPSVRLF